MIAPRRSHARAGLARRAGVPADHRRARPRRGARRAAGVVRALRRGARSRWTAAPRTWTGSRRCCGGSSSSRRPAARSTSWWPASTSAPSPTGTPRRRCSCTRAGILVMTPESAMVLTGKQALDYSGGVSAEDNFGIGGYERIMGPNGQAQYWAPDLAGACRVLLAYYEHTYVAPGERFPRRATTSDPDRPRRPRAPHAAPDSDLLRVGDVFSDATNPGRKKPFDIRSVMRAAIDATIRRSSAGRGCATRRARWSWTPTSAAGRSPSSASSRGRCPATARSPPTAPSSGRRARCSRAPRRRSRARSTPPAAAGRSSCSPTSRDSTARRSRCAVAARVRRRDRPRGRQLRRADRLLRRLALPRRRIRRVLAAAQRPTSRRSRSRARTRR